MGRFEGYRGVSRGFGTFQAARGDETQATPATDSDATHPTPLRSQTASGGRAGGRAQQDEGEVSGDPVVCVCSA